MRTPKSLFVLAAAGALSVPAAQAQQSPSPGAPAIDPPGPHARSLAAETTSAVRARLVRHTLHRQRKVAAVQGRELRKGYADALRSMSTDELVDRRREAKRDLQRARRKAVARVRAERRARAGAGSARGSASMPGHLAAIAQCESGGNPAAVGGGGTYRGLFQFDRSTWQSVGGSGDPAAAPVAEQVKRAQILYSRAGASPWPVCGS